MKWCQELLHLALAKTEGRSSGYGWFHFEWRKSFTLWKDDEGIDRKGKTGEEQQRERKGGRDRRTGASDFWQEAAAFRSLWDQLCLPSHAPEIGRKTGSTSPQTCQLIVALSYQHDHILQMGFPLPRVCPAHTCKLTFTTAHSLIFTAMVYWPTYYIPAPLLLSHIWFTLTKSVYLPATEVSRQVSEQAFK